MLDLNYDNKVEYEFIIVEKNKEGDGASSRVDDPSKDTATKMEKSDLIGPQKLMLSIESLLN